MKDLKHVLKKFHCNDNARDIRTFKDMISDFIIKGREVLNMLDPASMDVQPTPPDATKPTVDLASKQAPVIPRHAGPECG